MAKKSGILKNRSNNELLPKYAIAFRPKAVQ